MPQPKKGPRLGGSAAHHSMLLSNLATELFRHGRIRTTEGRARAVQPLAERMVTFAKRGDIHGRRQVLKVIRDKDVVHKLFTDIGPAFADRNGGYTRLLKLGPRKGDAAPMALLELVQGVQVAGEGDLEEAPRRRWSLRRRKGATLSTSARERAEERMAAVDAGEDLLVEDDSAGEAAEAVPVGTMESTASDQSGAGDEPAPQVSAAEVEARLAAEDEAATDAEAEAATDAEADAGGPAADEATPEGDDKA